MQLCIPDPPLAVGVTVDKKLIPLGLRFLICKMEVLMLRSSWCGEESITRTAVSVHLSWKWSQRPAWLWTVQWTMRMSPLGPSALLYLSREHCSVWPWALELTKCTHSYCLICISKNSWSSQSRYHYLHLKMRQRPQDRVSPFSPWDSCQFEHVSAYMRGVHDI